MKKLGTTKVKTRNIYELSRRDIDTLFSIYYERKSNVSDSSKLVVIDIEKSNNLLIKAVTIGISENYSRANIFVLKIYRLVIDLYENIVKYIEIDRIAADKFEFVERIRIREFT